MIRIFATIGILAFVFSTNPLAAQSTAPPTAESTAKARPWPVSKAPEEMQAVLNEIQSKLSTISSYTVINSNVYTAKKTGDKVAKEIKTAFRRPGNQFTKSMITESGDPTAVGTESISHCDGNILWEHAAKPQPKPVVTKYDVKKLEASGISIHSVIPFNPLLDPFGQADYSSLHVEKETPETWIIAGNVKLSNEVVFKMRWTFDRKTGLIQSREQTFGQHVTTDTYTDVTTNIALPDATFTYQPPTGAVVRDETSTLIKAAE